MSKTITKHNRNLFTVKTVEELNQRDFYMIGAGSRYAAELGRMLKADPQFATNERETRKTLVSFLMDKVQNDWPTKTNKAGNRVDATLDDVRMARIDDVEDGSDIHLIARGIYATVKGWERTFEKPKGNSDDSGDSNNGNESEETPAEINPDQIGELIGQLADATEALGWGDVSKYLKMAKASADARQNTEGAEVPAAANG